jgi:hypothetical protein
MYENPPGYEVEQPIDLSKPVSQETAVSPEAPPAERRSRSRKPRTPSESSHQDSSVATEVVKTDADTADAAAPGEVVLEAVSGVIVVANLQPLTFKSTVSKMLYAILSPAHGDVRLWNGISGARSGGLVIADMPRGQDGAVWWQQSAMADQLVIPVPDDAQAANAAAWMLDQLESAGRSELARSAVIVAIQTGRHPVLARRITKYFGTRTTELVRVKLPRAIVSTEDRARWEPLATTVLRTLKQRMRSRLEEAGPAAGSKVVHLDTRRHQGKAVS